MVNKVSKITYNDIASYLRLDISNDEQEINNLKTYLSIAKDFISNYTGIPLESDDDEAETLDTYSDFVAVVYILCQDMYDNRCLYVDKNSINKVVETILNMHCRINL